MLHATRQRATEMAVDLGLHAEDVYSTEQHSLALVAHVQQRFPYA